MRGFEIVVWLALVLLHKPFSTLDLFFGFETALPACSDPFDRIAAFRNKPGFGAPGDDELAGSAAASYAMDGDRFRGPMVLIHELDEAFDLSIGGYAVIGDVDVMVGELTRDIPAIVELTAIHHGSDVVLLIDLKDVGIGPPRSSDHVFDDPGKGLGSFGLAVVRPIPGSDRFGHR